MELREMANKGIYMKKTISSLSGLASTIFSTRLLATLESVYNQTNETETLDQIREYLIAIGTTTPAYQELLKTILSFRSKTHALAVELLFNKYFNRLELPECADSDRLVTAVAEKCTSLECLDLTHLQLGVSRWYLYEEILRNCPNLRMIKLTDNSNNSCFLPLLSNYCPKLRDLYTPCIYRLQILDKASFKTTLTSINITDYDFDYEEYLTEIEPILTNCPNIISICPDFHLDKVVQKCRNSDKNFSCKLESLSIGATNEAELKLLISACPKLLDISLNSPADCSLEILSELPLQRLYISDFDYQDLLRLVRNIGQNLQILELISVAKRNTVNVYELLSLCPDLTKLKLVAVGACCRKPIETPPALTKFLMANCSNFPKPDLINFLSGLHNLKEFYAEEVPLDDFDMEKIFMNHNFLQLEKIFIMVAKKLTALSVHGLLHFCPKLKFIGSLSRWNMIPNDIKSIPYLEAVGDSVYWKMYVELFNY